MPVVINSNIASLNAHRRLQESTSSLQSTFQKLSSGLRISRASDDAAGLAIADSLNADKRILNQGIRNVNDGISLLSIAEGAVRELGSVTLRLSELAEQAANGTLSTLQRRSLDQEAQALSREYRRIVQTTTFNGLKLLDETRSTVTVEAGLSRQSGTDLNLGNGLHQASVGLGTFTNAVNPIGSSSRVAFSDFNEDGISDLVTSIGTAGQTWLGNGDGTFKFHSQITNASSSFSINLVDFTGDGNVDFIGANTGSHYLSVAVGNGDGTFKARASVASTLFPHWLEGADLNNDGRSDLIVGTGDSYTTWLSNGDGTFKVSASVTGYSNDNPWDHSFSTADFNEDGRLDIVYTDYNVFAHRLALGNGDGTFVAPIDFSVGATHTVSAADLNGDGHQDFVAAANGARGVFVYLGNGNGTFRAEQSFAPSTGQSVVSGDLNGDGFKDLVVSQVLLGEIHYLLGNGNGTFRAPVSYSSSFSANHVIYLEDINGDGVSDVVGASSGSGDLNIFTTDVTTQVSLPTFSLQTKTDALAALILFKIVRDDTAKELGNIGSVQSRLNALVANARTTTLNYEAAESRLRDADVATESSTLVRARMLQQAGSAVLAQANQQPGLALRLLNNI